MDKAVGLVACLVLAGLVAVPGLAQDERPRRVVNVSLDDQGCPAGPDRFCVTPDSVELEDGADLVLRVTNEGRIEHNLTFTPDTPERLAKHGTNGSLAPNESQRVRIPWPAVEESLGEDGRVNATLECGFDGHAELGERLTIHVPSLAEASERREPGPGVWAALALGVGAVLLARKR